ncbi:hypothetical protein [Occallatibacter savannae]|uniref:hypothetical protein n=1 Tax=Occallatibacter savannae TaxID=1002691 RepID=UPI0013A59CC7|nr:hypothetical protein [Occallatibacter savannae]
MNDALTGMDFWSFKPALVALMIVAALEVLCQLPGLISLVLVPLLFLGYRISFLVIGAIAVYCAIKKRPRRAISVLFVVLLPVLLWRPVNWAAEVIHLGLTVGLGVGQLGTPSSSKGGDFVTYDWSVGLAGGPNTFLIHDSSDEIVCQLLSMHIRKAPEMAWKKNARAKLAV